MQQPGLVQKLFDKELDNHHEEALLLAQLAAAQLRQTLQAGSESSLEQRVVTWADAALEVRKTINTT